MGHFYDTAGNPVYQVEKKDGSGLRDTTIADARKLGLGGSVTTISSLVAKPGLDHWKTTQVLDAAWEISKKGDKARWVSEVMMTSRKSSESAAKEGNRIHNNLENYLKGQTPDKLTAIDLEAQVFLGNWLDAMGANNEKNDLCVMSEKSFYHPAGFGGKVDLHGNTFVLDFKTKNTDDPAKMVGWDEHIMQLAAYREGLGLPNAKCYNMFISTKVPGLIIMQEYTEEELVRGWQMFSALLVYWKLQNGL